MKIMISAFENEYAFLSNFYNSPIVIDNIAYPTVEHFFQAMKSFNDNDRKRVASAPTPGIAKRMGRMLPLRPDWESVKEDLMYLGLRVKFANKELAEQLLDTGDAELTEGNWWHDNTWGDCQCERCGGIPGQNKLGKLLMRVREEIKNEILS
jgi:ribA/ribD-fused uncharacterized protein